MNILEALSDKHLFAPAFPGETWRAWRAFLGCLFGLELDAGGRALAEACTGRAYEAARGYSEAWMAIGRRGGKSRAMALLAAFLATFRDWRPHLAPGEVATVAVIAPDRRQAGVILRYVRALLRDNDMLRREIVAETAERIELAGRVAIEVFSARSVRIRGYSIAAALCDEIAFWPRDDSADPDVEILNALRPAMATLPGSMLIAASSPHARRGELWQMYRRHHAKPGAKVLFWQAPTLTMNPSLPAELVERALEEDPERARAEWLAEFRRDVEALFVREALEACVEPGARERPPVPGIRYSAFVDPSGGSADSMTLAIAHLDQSVPGGLAVLDCVRERRPPFSPDEVVHEFAEVLRHYRVSRVVGDRYAGEWPRERFWAHRVVYDPSASPKSEIYGAMLPLVNSRRAELLDDPRLLAQLAGLERRTARGGRDSIDHPPGSHDDLANAAAGALVTLTSNRWPDPLMIGGR